MKTLALIIFSGIVLARAVEYLFLNAFSSSTHHRINDQKQMNLYKKQFGI